MKNAVRSTLAKSNIIHVQKKSRSYLLLYLPGCCTRGEVCPVGCIWDPNFGRREGHRGYIPFERAMLVSYRLSIVAIALSLTIRPLFVIECLRRSNQQGVGQFGAKSEEEWVCKPNFNTIGERHGAKMTASISSAVWAQCMSE